MKRYAAHYIYLPEQGYLKKQVIEVDKGQVVCIFPLTEEIEDVAWFPGVIMLSYDEFQRVQLYWCYPFDFKTMQSVSGTRRILLQ